MTTWLRGLGALIVLPSLHAQKLFVAFEGDAVRVVQAVRYHSPLVEDGNKLRDARSKTYGLRHAAVYGTGQLALTNLRIVNLHLKEINTGVQLNYELQIQADVTSDADLGNCFLVVDLASEGEQGCVFEELPDFQAGRTRHVGFRFPVRHSLDKGHYHLYFFSDGLELLTSQMPPAFVAEQKRKTEAFMLRDQADMAATVARSVAPVYPPALAPGGPAGSATIRCLINADGRLVEAAVVNASQPAFGEAALAAVRQWQFGPAVKDHHYVAATVVIPFEFPAPPVPAK